VGPVRREPSISARAAAVLLLAAALVAGGCGGNGEDDPNVDPTNTTITTPPVTITTPPVTTTTTKPPRKTNIIAWILGLGPGAPVGPPEFTAYRELQSLRCSAVLDKLDDLDDLAQRLYTAAAQACLAAFNGKAQLWAKAEAVYDDVSAKKDQLNCLDLAALAVLERLIAAHRQDPGGSFKPSGKQASGKNQRKAPPCPTITRIEPDHGVQGTTVTIFGRHLDEQNIIRVEAVPSDNNNAQAVGDLTYVDGGVQFTMPEGPPPEVSSLICLVVVAEPDWRADGGFFRYESEDSTAPPDKFACPKAEF
jgi:hypothetical protein